MKNGYQLDFLGANILLPEFDTITKQLTDNIQLNYTNFTILFSKERKMPIYTVVNIDGKGFVSIGRKSDKWKYDNRFSENNQLGQDFYRITGAYFHKGHIVRRLDPCWGAEAETAEGETFHFTNACPQHKNFNPQIWLELERSLLEKGAVENDDKITVFSGPVLSKIDKPYIEQVNNEWIFIPSHFWKVIVWKKKDNKLYAVGFIQSQKEYINKFLKLDYGLNVVFREANDDGDYYENIKFKNGDVYQVNIDIIEKLTGLSFDFDNVILPKIKDDKMVLTVKKDYSKAYLNGRFKNLAKTTYSIEGLVLD